MRLTAMRRAPAGCRTERAWLAALRCGRLLIASLIAACSGADRGPAVTRDAGTTRARCAQASAERAALAGCDAGTAWPNAGGASPQLLWHTASVELESDGRTRPWSVELPRGTRAFGVRSSISDPALSGNACFQLEEVTVQGDQTWVGQATTDDYGDYCVACPERVAVGAGYGFHVLPSGADDSLELRLVQLRVALRDCVTQTPLSAAAAGVERLQLEDTAWLPAAPDAPLELPVSIVIASAHGFAADQTLLVNALDRMRTTWSAAGVELTFAAQLTIEPPTTPVGYAANDREQLIALTRAAHAALDTQRISRAWPVVVLTGCLRRRDVLTGGQSEPLAITPHIPGGFGLNDEPDLILIAAERCAGLVPGPRFLDPETLGAVLAHELGHYLGLFHVIESDGRQDRLPDTSPDQSNLMQAAPSPEALAITDGQRQAARRHPAFELASRSTLH